MTETGHRDTSPSTERDGASPVPHLVATPWSGRKQDRLDHGEGPCWDPHLEAMRCVDLLAGELVTFDDTGHISRHHLDDVVAAWRPRRDGGVVAAVERGFVLLDSDGTIERLGELWTDTSVRMNDGTCDTQGRFYCGSMGYDATPGAGALWVLDTAGRATIALDAVTISNGLAWAPEGDRAYYVDTPTGGIDVLRFAADGTVDSREPWVEIDPAFGGPDGLTLDAQGGVWVALWGGGRVHHYLPDATLGTVVTLDTPQSTACAFGGAGLATLYITTSQQGLTGPDPRAGSTYAVRPGVVGTPPLMFGA